MGMPTYSASKFTRLHGSNDMVSEASDLAFRVVTPTARGAYLEVPASMNIAGVGVANYTRTRTDNDGDVIAWVYALGSNTVTVYND